MPTDITKYKIFLASPSDLKDDRASFDEVIDELNLTFGIQNNISLELLKWETHSGPAISKINPQKIINKDLGQDFDLFIGLLWKKFGTPTDDTGSGTEEEFLNAYKRFLGDSNSLQILFYFNTSPIPLSDINPDEIRKIQDFKIDIGENKKLLYWEYQDTQQLNKFLRIHIPKRILELHSNHSSEIQKNEEVESVVAEVIDEEFGVFDYLDMIEEFMGESIDSLSRISNATIWIGEQMERKTSELGVLTLNGNNPGRKVVKGIVTRTAKVMDNFANRIEPEIPIFFDNFEKGIDAYSKLLNISRNDLEVEEKDRTEAIESLTTLIDGIETSMDSMNGFLSSINDFPRMSKELNKAKSNVATRLDDLLNNLRISNSIAVELKKSLE